jgi:hypothetical protein
VHMVRILVVFSEQSLSMYGWRTTPGGDNISALVPQVYFTLTRRATCLQTSHVSPGSLCCAHCGYLDVR